MFRLPKAIRRFVRKHTRPKEPTDAVLKRSRYSLAYVLIAWNVLGLTVYQFYKHGRFTASDGRGLSDGRFFADYLGQEKVILKRYHNFSKVGEWNLKEEKKDHGRLLTDVELADMEAINTQAADETLAGTDHVDETLLGESEYQL